MSAKKSFQFNIGTKVVEQESTLFSVCDTTGTKGFRGFFARGVYVDFLLNYFNGCCQICWRIFTFKLRYICVFQVLLEFKHSKEKNICF
jgi:hypothetical protein